MWSVSLNCLKSSVQLRAEFKFVFIFATSRVTAGELLSRIPVIGRRSTSGAGAMVRAELKVIGGKQHGSLIPLQTKKFLVGREQDCQLRPSSESVSRHHCVFTLDDFSVRLRDLGSTNGTFVNGQRVQGQVVLQPNDRILIGKLEFEVVLRDAVPAVHHARVAASVVSDSNPGFSLNDLAEMPENAAAETTLNELSPTKILESTPDVGSPETKVMSMDSTSVIPPLPPATAQPNPTETIPVLDELPVVANDPNASLPAIPLAPDEPPLPMVAAQAPPVAPGMPGQPMPMMPYGMPPQMPGAYPQPQFLQAPFASFSPQYMPNPYGMPQPFMPQPYVDPNFAYQQQLAQQQAMMAAQAQYAPPPATAEEPDPVSSITAAAAAAPAVKLPPPEETGAKPPAPPPPPTPAAEGATQASAPQTKPNQLAADIIKKYMNRR